MEGMPKVQKQIARYILENPFKVVRMPITQLSMESGAKSDSSVVRFYRTIGFSGFYDFKVVLATELAGKSFYHIYNGEDVEINDGIETIKQKIFLGAMKTLQENLEILNYEVLTEALDLIEKANRLIFLGFASSAAIALDAYFKFSRLGLNCHFSTDPHINAVILAESHKEDVIFGISYSGESKDVVIPARRAKPVAKVIALTGFPDSSLGKIADICITTVSKEMNYRTDAMVSRIVQLAVVDILYTSLAVRKGSQGLDKLRISRQSLSYLKY